MPDDAPVVGSEAYRCFDGICTCPDFAFNVLQRGRKLFVRVCGGVQCDWVAPYLRPYSAVQARARRAPCAEPGSLLREVC